MFIAAQEGKKDVVTELIDVKGIILDKADNDGITPLEIAAINNHPEALELLLQACNNKEKICSLIDQRDKRGYTPLTHAVISKNDEIIKLLLQYGANPTSIVIRENNRISPKELFKSDDEEVVKLFNTKAKEFKDRAMGFIEDVKKSNKINEASDIFITSIDVNGADDFKDTLLIAAIFKGHKKLVELLIKNGADVNALNMCGYTPLLTACWQDHMDIVELLIAEKANVNASCNEGGTSLPIMVIKN